MCQSIAKGGQRCSTHLRPDYLKALKPALEKGEITYQQQIILGAAAIPYATTRSGIKAINEDILFFLTHSKPDIAEVLRISLLEGEKQRAVTKEIEAIIEAKEEGHAFGVAVMSMASEAGLDLVYAYKTITNTAAEVSKDFRGSSNSSERKWATSKETAEILCKSIVSGALELFYQMASQEEISNMLEERTSEIGEDIKISSGDFSKIAEEIRKAVNGVSNDSKTDPTPESDHK